MIPPSESVRQRRDAEARFAAGMREQAQGRMDAAEICYREALRLSPGFIEAHYNLALLCKLQMRLGEAAEGFARAAQLSPGFADAYQQQGAVLAAMGRPEEAVNAFQRTVQIKPDHLPAWYGLGSALLQLQRNDEAEQALSRLLAMRPNLPEVQCQLASLRYAMNRFGEAESGYRQALAFNPQIPEAWCGLGTLLLRTGREGEAESSYHAALRLRPDYPALHHEWGSLLRTLGRGREAVDHLRIALRGAGGWEDRLRRLVDPWIVLDGIGACAAPTPPPDAACVMPINVAGMTFGDEKTQRTLRIVLIYPPPWKLGPYVHPDGEDRFAPPFDPAERTLDSDFETLPYGLLTLAANARRAGHAVEVFNLATVPWREVETLVAETPADVFGLSAFTANRRGMGAVAELVRQHHPAAHIVAGGPFVTALPRETLHHYPAIDVSVIGEGESTFDELLQRVARGQPTTGVAGTAWRDGTSIRLGPDRPRIGDLDQLASPFDYFSNYIVMTSRGCPSRCSFCGSFASWGKKLRFHSVEATLDLFRQALARLPVAFLAIKDDTFTAHRRRALRICEGIVASGMNFLWSCDTRVDSLDEELLRAMRLAGCQRISLGIESGSPQILDAIHKNTTPEQALEITRLARQYGIHVRYYMIVGNRGESPETVRQSIELIRAARPEFVTFCLLGFLPGTEEWDILRQQTGLSADIFFTHDFTDLNVARCRHAEWNVFLEQVLCEIGGEGFEFDVVERQAVVERLPQLPAAHADLANAFFRAGRLDEAETALEQAAALGFPIPAVLDNQRACIALARGDAQAALRSLEQALADVDAPLLRINSHNLRIWMNGDPARRGRSPRLNDSVHGHDFQLYDESDARGRVKRPF